MGLEEFRDYCRRNRQRVIRNDHDRAIYDICNNPSLAGFEVGAELYSKVRLGEFGSEVDLAVVDSVDSFLYKLTVSRHSYSRGVLKRLRAVAEYTKLMFEINPRIGKIWVPRAGEVIISLYNSDN